MKNKIKEIVIDWYIRGFNGAFPSDWGKGVFHYLEDIKEAGDESYSFYIDFGSADIDKAINNLAEELYFYGYTVGNNPESIHDYVLIKKI